MNNLYLKFPTIEDKEQWLEYVDEYVRDNEKAKPLSYDKNIDYEEWLRKINKEHIGVDIAEGRVPCSVYFLTNGERLLAHISIRHTLDSPMLALYGGNIGYGVRPSERRKGYATKMLNLALEKCKDLGIERVMISCNVNNIGSKKVIENNFGEFEKDITIDSEQATFKRYWIDIEKVLNKKIK